LTLIGFNLKKELAVREAMIADEEGAFIVDVFPNSIFHALFRSVLREFLRRSMK